MSYVYQPSEDSYLLRATAVDHASPSDVVIDVGTGSGVVGAVLTEDCQVIGVDINREACLQAVEHFPVVQGNTLTCFGDGVADLVVFNPPYLPTDERETVDEMRAHGDNGDAITTFLSEVHRVLGDDGVALLLVSTRTPLTVEDAARDHGLTVTTVASTNLQFETLRVLALRTSDQNV